MSVIVCGKYCGTHRDKRYMSSVVRCTVVRIWSNL